MARRFRPRFAPAALLLVVLLAGCSSSGGPEGPPGGGPPGSAAPTARVIRTVDGDTILVALDGRREYVRYIGVDTPETVKPGAPVECFGAQAHRLNKRLVQGRTVRLRFDAERRDKYDRLLAYVYRGRHSVGEILIRRGAARTLTIPPNDRFATRLQRLEALAGRRGRGLWSAC